MKYLLYARKSTEDEERQIMSIEAQLAELAEYAERKNLEVIETFVESKSAKKPGREIFNGMILKVSQNKEPVGLISWHPDRLARNSIDGGQIIYLIDTGKIASLRFPTFWFEPTPQGLFMLQVAFGQSKYYSDNLSENVKRGIRQKLRRGEWCGVAPLGYVNNLKTHTIEPDEVKTKIIAKAFEEFSQGQHTLKGLSDRLNFWGVVSRTGKSIAISLVQRMLMNPVYIGLIKRNGEIHQGSFKSIVSPAIFEAVQQRLKARAKPRHSKQRHDFPFLGLFRCAECGAAITAQFAKGNGGIYRYYRCTKRLGSCSQKYLREDLLTEQLKQRLQEVAITDEWKEKMFAQVELWEKQDKQTQNGFAQNLNLKIKETEEKLNKLVNSFLEGIVEKETYLEKKEELLRQKIALEAKKEGFGQRGNNWNEPLRNWILEAHHAKNLSENGKLPDIRQFVEKIGTNRRLENQKVFWEFVKPYDLLANLSADERSSEAGLYQNLRFPIWQGHKDLNLN